MKVIHHNARIHEYCYIKDAIEEQHRIMNHHFVCAIVSRIPLFLAI